MSSIPSLDSYSGVRAFVAVAEHRGFAAAAPMLGLSPSAVGKAVARLEARLGVRLLARTTRSVALTEDGRLYHARCVAALAGLADAEAELRQGRSEPSGLLRVALPPLLGRTFVMPVLLDLVARWPALRLEASFDAAPVDLTAGGVDLAVRIGRLDDRAGLSARPLGVQRRVVCATPAYLDARGRPGTVQDLAAHDCLAEARDGRPAPWPYVDADGAARSLAVDGRVRIGDAQMLAQAALAGAGIAMVPRWLVAEDLVAGRLEAVLDGVFDSPLPVSLVWPRTPWPSARLRAAIDALVDRYAARPPWAV
ncbi:LysR family transcriptional regulator [Caulobacter endophyticus]|uniref:LysR family transcriptional regulator n=1 Tax=Caulobacter endophyticus TaxID=2172652 RepID=A0A2T9JNR3_9CAUL|nr:LysR family transcriptional regulator [Caulobacter endophyticus]PVM85266.1 LysR family transcriptional regulator [Caulobacter endophyticus]